MDIWHFHVWSFQLYKGLGLLHCNHFPALLMKLFALHIPETLRNRFLEIWGKGVQLQGRKCWHWLTLVPILVQVLGEESPRCRIHQRPVGGSQFDSRMWYETNGERVCTPSVSSCLQYEDPGPPLLLDVLMVAMARNAYFSCIPFWTRRILPWFSMPCSHPGLIAIARCIWICP